MSLRFGFLWHAALVYGSFRNCLINVITRIPMERPPYNPYNYILWDFPSSSLNIKYYKSTNRKKYSNRRLNARNQKQSVPRRILHLWSFIFTCEPTFENSYRVRRKWMKREYWGWVNRRGWGYSSSGGASIWNLYSTPHNWWAGRPTNLQMLISWIQFQIWFIKLSILT